MHDTSDLERRGIPTVYVATSEFTSGAEVQAEALGFDHTVVYVEHPIQDRTDAEMQAIADAAFEALKAGLVGAG